MRSYFSDKITECGNSKKCLFKLTKYLMGRKGEIILPICSSDEHLANKFSDFFMRKITTIRDDIDNHKSPISDAVVMSADVKFEGQPLTKLAPATQDEVRTIIVKSASKSYELDPLPTYMLKEVLKYLLPLITAITNKSLWSPRFRFLSKRPKLDHCLRSQIWIKTNRKITAQCLIYLSFRRSRRSWMLSGWRPI